MGSSSCSFGSVRCKKLTRVLFSHVGLFAIVAAYAVAGAYIFIELELPSEELRKDRKFNVTMDLIDAKSYISKLLWYHNEKNHNKTTYDRLVKKNLRNLHDFVVTKASDPLIRYDGHFHTWDYDWTFTKSLLFTVTSMAAIGYGHICPKTFYGQIVTVIYSMIGVPLLLLFLANIGDILATSFKFMYSRLCCRCCRIRRKLTELLPGASFERKVLWEENVGAEDYMPTDEITVPIVVNLLIIAIYLCIGGAWFSAFEGWDLPSSVYFCFITLTTIGFGDMVPGSSYLHGADSVINAAVEMSLTVAYCIVGMALVSMCINLMQDQLVKKCRWFALQVGIIEEDYDPIVKYKIKRSKNVRQTPADRDGNRRMSIHEVEDGGESTHKNYKLPQRKFGRVYSKKSNDLLLSDAFEDIFGNKIVCNDLVSILK